MLARMPAFAMGDSVETYESTVLHTETVHRPNTVSRKRRILVECDRRAEGYKLPSLCGSPGESTVCT